MWDLALRFVRRLLYGHDAEPTPYLIFIILHHTCGWTCIPFNIYYPDYYYYWNIVFTMEFVATYGDLISEYKYFLDLKTRSGKFKMKVLVISTFFIVFWGRGINYTWNSYHILKHFYETGMIIYLFILYICTFVVFGFFNFYVMIWPYA